MTSSAGNQKGKSKLRSALSCMKSLVMQPVGLIQKLSLRPFGWIHGGPATAIAKLFRLREFSPEVVLAGYVQGAFPTGNPKGSIDWHSPDERAIIETGKVHISKRLKSYLNKSELEITFNKDFRSTIQACADREKTWITPDIIRVYNELHSLGYAHSVEARSEGELVGGGYGIALGKVFFLESMFCRQDQASKIAFVHLARKLEADRFLAIDCQFLTGHWQRFGAKPMDRTRFQSIVTIGLNEPAKFRINRQNERTLSHELELQASL